MNCPLQIKMTLAMLLVLAAATGGCWTALCSLCPTPLPTPGPAPTVAPTATATATRMPQATATATATAPPAPTATPQPTAPPPTPTAHPGPCPGEWDLCLDLTDSGTFPPNTRLVNGVLGPEGLQCSDSGPDLVVPLSFRQWTHVTVRMVVRGLHGGYTQPRTHLLTIGTWCDAAYTNPAGRWPAGCWREDWAVLELMRFGVTSNPTLSGAVCWRQENGATEPAGGCCCGRYGCLANLGRDFDPSAWTVLEVEFVCPQLTGMNDAAAWIGGIGDGPKARGFSGLTIGVVALRFK